MTAALLLAALLSLSDPAGDAIGNGSLTPPTALVFRSQDALDARELEVPKGSTFGFDLTFAHLSNPWNLPNGFSLPLIEVYLETDKPGQSALLLGSGMHLPEGAHWNYAFKLTGDSFKVYQADPTGSSPSNITEQAAAKVVTQGNTIVASTSLPLPRHFELYAVVGSYDPFFKTGWRPVEREPSPWAYASDDQSVPVMDVLASSFELQEHAINSATLPTISTPPGFNRWLLVMGLGVLLILIGLVGRFRVKPKRRTPGTSRPARAPVVGTHPIPPEVPAGFRAPPVVTVTEKRLEPTMVVQGADDGDGRGEEEESAEHPAEEPLAPASTSPQQTLARLEPEVFEEEPSDPADDANWEDTWLKESPHSSPEPQAQEALPNDAPKVPAESQKTPADTPQETHTSPVADEKTADAEL